MDRGHLQEAPLRGQVCTSQLPCYVVSIPRDWGLVCSYCTGQPSFLVVQTLKSHCQGQLPTAARWDAPQGTVLSTRPAAHSTRSSSLDSGPAGWAGTPMPSRPKGERFPASQLGQPPQQNPSTSESVTFLSIFSSLPCS